MIEDPAWMRLVTHDVKNALAALEDRLERVALQDTPPDRATLQSVHRQCRALRRRLVALLMVQRAGMAAGDGGADAKGAGDGEGLIAFCLDEEPAALLRAAAESADVLDAGRRPLEIVVDTPEGDALWGSFDRSLVQLALDAGLHNALRHADRRVELSCGPRDGGIWFAIRDDGPGLPDANGSPPAAPGEHDRDPREHRTGLGTALCQAVVRAHRLEGRCGRLTLDGQGLPNRLEGRGARFELWLP